MVRLSSPRLLPLTILIMLFLLIVKAATFAEDAGAAMGLVPSAQRKAIAPSNVQSSSGADRARVSSAAMLAPPVASEVNAKERALLQDLRKRSEALDHRERALDEQSGILQAAESRLQRKIDQLAQLEVRLDLLERKREEQKGAEWEGLVKVYEDMRPGDAAAIFNVLDMHVLLELLDRMKDRKAAAVLAAMQPERARVATQMLARMRLHEDAVTPANLGSARPGSLGSGDRS